MLKAIIHKITALVLIVILFANNINTLVIIGDFIVNQDFIAKTLCIQKEEQKGCNGKCYLAEELKKNTGKDKDYPIQTEQRTELSHFILTSNRLKASAEHALIVSKKHVFFFAQDLKPLLFVFKIKEPPEQLTHYLL